MWSMTSMMLLQILPNTCARSFWFSKMLAFDLINIVVVLKRLHRAYFIVEKTSDFEVYLMHETAFS